MTETKHVVIRERWPDIPGHPGGVKLESATRKATTSDGRFWMVRRRGLFRRWHWMPANGVFVTLHEVD